MFKFDKTDVQRITVSGVGAMALSAACIFGVAGPAHAATVDQWKGSVQQQLDANNSAIVHDEAKRPAETDLALRFDANGRYAGATVVKSSGDRMLDRSALLAARETKYEALPAGYSKVTMRILHDASATTVAAERQKDAIQYASAGGAGFKVFAK